MPHPAPRPARQERLPKKDRKALARELARMERQRQAARRRRRRRLAWSGAGAAVVAAGVVGVLVVQASVRAGQVGPRNMQSDGVVLTGDGTTVSALRTDPVAAGGDPTPTAVDRSSGVLDLVVYLDYRSPEAAAFWSASSSAVEGWVTGGYATLELHPLALLDGAPVEQTAASDPAATAASDPAATAASDPAAATASDPAATTASDPAAATASDPAATADPGASAPRASAASDSAATWTGDYSARAAGTLGCVADGAPDQALAVHDALLAAQPGLDADGLDDDELVDLVQKAGVTDEAVADCVRSEGFADWAQDATARAADGVPFDVGSVTTSPVVLVAGHRYTGPLDDPDALLTFIEQVSTELAAAQAQEAPSTPAPTDAATTATDPATDPSDPATTASDGATAPTDAATTAGDPATTGNDAATDPSAG